MLYYNMNIYYSGNAHNESLPEWTLVEAWLEITGLLR